MLGSLAAAPARAQQPKDIVDTAVAAGSFKTLAKALKAAGLVDTLKGPGPFTVFAPTDEAFAKLPAGTLENLLKPENKDKLRRILTYHVVPGKVRGGRRGEAADGEDCEWRHASRSRSGTARCTVDDANVTKTDIQASNGVIHVIDTVILPKGI